MPFRWLRVKYKEKCFKQTQRRSRRKKTNEGDNGNLLQLFASFVDVIDHELTTIGIAMLKREGK